MALMIYNQSILTVEISRRAIALNKLNRKEGSGAVLVSVSSLLMLGVSRIN